MYATNVGEHSGGFGPLLLPGYVRFLPMLREFQHILDMFKKLLIPLFGNFGNMSRVAQSVNVKGFR